VSLLGLDPEPVRAEQAIAGAQTWLITDAPREVVFTMGSDDGCRVFLNGQLVLQDDEEHGASPLQHVGRLALDAGRNHLLVEVRNGWGNFGLYFRILDDEITVSADHSVQEAR
jgi:hypothetical protein